MTQGEPSVGNYPALSILQTSFYFSLASASWIVRSSSTETVLS